jgi:hypothetical protein
MDMPCALRMTRLATAVGISMIMASVVGLSVPEGALGVSKRETEARSVSHVVPPTRRLVVTFEYWPGRGGPGSLLRFAQNRLAVVRTGNGRLAIDGASRRLLTRGRATRRLAVRLVVDLNRRRITARVRARSIRIPRRPRSERRIIVDRRRCCVRRLTIRLSSRPAANQPTGSGTGAAPSTTPSAQFVAGLFAPESVWRAPLADDAPLDSASARLVGGLRSAVAANLAARTGPWIATNESSTPLYRVPADQPRVRVQLHTGPWGATLQKAFEAVPVPPDARPARGTDAHMTVWQPSTDRLWEFFRMRKESDGWHADYGGAIENVSRSPGYYTTDSWPGLSNSQWGASASSLPLVAGLMRTDELRAGHIDHAVSLAIPVARRNVFSWPAQRTDGRSDDANAIPEGAHFRLDPTLDLSTLNLPRMTRIMAEAAQRYGMIVTDQTGQAVGFAAEDPTPTGNDPYYGTNGLFDGHWPSELLAQFPWEHLQLLRMDLHTT